MVNWQSGPEARRPPGPWVKRWQRIHFPSSFLATAYLLQEISSGGLRLSAVSTRNKKFFPSNRAAPTNEVDKPALNRSGIALCDFFSRHGSDGGCHCYADDC